MALRLEEVIHHIVDNSQSAFQKQKRASDVARLVQDIINLCDDQDEEGLIVFCDQHKTYDRVSWNFMLLASPRGHEPPGRIHPTH